MFLSQILNHLFSCIFQLRKSNGLLHTFYSSRIRDELTIHKKVLSLFVGLAFNLIQLNFKPICIALQTVNKTSS